MRMPRTLCKETNLGVHENQDQLARSHSLSMISCALLFSTQQHKRCTRRVVMAHCRKSVQRLLHAKAVRTSSSELSVIEM